MLRIRPRLFLADRFDADEALVPFVTEFVCALGNEICENTVEPGSGEDAMTAKPRTRSELNSGPSVDFPMVSRRVSTLEDRQIAIPGVDYTLNGHGERVDITGGANQKGGRIRSDNRSS
jgi:hypothetical protein